MSEICQKEGRLGAILVPSSQRGRRSNSTMMGGALIAALVASCIVWWSNYATAANAYQIESRFVGSKALSSTSYMNIVERPLAPPFPNGPCDGKVITIPQKDLYRIPDDNSVFFNNFNTVFPNPFASVQDVILTPRDIKVWVPKEYHTLQYSQESFPVLYCHDGQNGKCQCCACQEMWWCEDDIYISY
jgi:hypothetical protein